MSSSPFLSQMTFPTKQGISQHMSKKHYAHLVPKLISSVENNPQSESMAVLDNNCSDLSSPPPAHLASKSESKPTLDDIDKATSSRLLKSYLMNKPNSNLLFEVSAPRSLEASQPLDFSKKSSPSSSSSRLHQLGASTSNMNTPSTSSSSSQEPGAILISEDQPMDLSVSKPSTSPSPSKSEENQVESGVLLKEWLSRTKRQSWVIAHISHITAHRHPSFTSYLTPIVISTISRLAALTINSHLYLIFHLRINYS